MVDFTFRFPFRLPHSKGVSINDASIVLDNYSYSVKIIGEPEKSIANSKEFIVIGSGFATEADAFEAGQKLRNTLILTFLDFKIGADFGDDSITGGLFDSFVNSLSHELKKEVRVHVNGLMVYPTQGTAGILKAGKPKFEHLISSDRFLSVLNTIFTTDYSLRFSERISYNLFSFSSFSSSGYDRLLFLIMAIEVLLEPMPRSPQAIGLIESFVVEVKRSQLLEHQDRDSLITALSYLRNESIRHSARRLLESKLPKKNYGGLSAIALFQDCYKGELSEAEDLLIQMLDVSDDIPNMLLAMCDLAYLYNITQRFEEALTLVNKYKKDISGEQTAILRVSFYINKKMYPDHLHFPGRDINIYDAAYACAISSSLAMSNINYAQDLFDEYEENRESDVLFYMVKGCLRLANGDIAGARESWGDALEYAESELDSEKINEWLNNLESA